MIQPRCVEAGGGVGEGFTGWGGSGFVSASLDGSCGEQCVGEVSDDIASVSWDDIQEFIAWLNARTGGGYRLPTESEWEYAARAGGESQYSWGIGSGTTERTVVFAAVGGMISELPR